MKAKGVRRRPRGRRYQKRVAESGAGSGEPIDLQKEDTPVSQSGHREKRSSKNVRLLAWFTADEMECLNEVCHARDCGPEQLVRELVLCELARYRTIEMKTSAKRLNAMSSIREAGSAGVK
jgi:hypothetical protein